MLIFLISMIGCNKSVGTKVDSIDPEKPETPDTPDTSTTEDISFVVSAINPKPISPYFYGQNYWSWVVQWGGQVLETEEAVSDLHLNILRMGGTQPDQNTPEPFDIQKLDQAMAYAQKVGAEPILQLPLLKDWELHDATAQSAMQMVRYVNEEKHYGVKYFSIGNEPDLYVEQSQKEADYDPQTACALFAEIHDSIKAFDPSLQIVGPDFAKFSATNDWFQSFVGACKDKIDIFAIHRYPFHPTLTTQRNVLNDRENYRSTLISIKQDLKNFGLENIPFALTETNVTWDGNPANKPLEASPGSFLAGLWVADILGVSMEEELWNVSFWSISEGWTLGFIDGNNNSPRPAYYVLKMFTEHFGDQILQVESELEDVSVYASRDTQTTNIVLAVINKSTSEENLAWKIKDSETSSRTYQNVFPALSLTIIIQPMQGNAEIWQYRGDLAAENQAPVQLKLTE